MDTTALAYFIAAETTLVEFLQNDLTPFAVSLSAIATIAIASVAYIQFRHSVRESRENRKLSRAAMADQTLAMLLRTLSDELGNIRILERQIPRSGAAALKSFWVRARNRDVWCRAPGENAVNAELNTAREIYNEFFAYDSALKFEGDVESVIRLWANSAQVLLDHGVEPDSTRGLLLREFHPKELGFALYIVAMIRKEKELIEAARDFRLLDRCVKEEVLHTRHREFLFSVVSRNK